MEEQNPESSPVRQEDWEPYPERLWDGKCSVPASAMWFKDPGGTVEFYKDEETPKFRMVGYTGGAMPHPFFGKVLVDVSGIELGKTKKKGRKGVLREHNPYRIVGYGTPARRDGAITMEDGVFSQTTRDGREVQGLQAEGYPWECSINIDRAKLVDLPRGESMEVNGKLHKGPAVVFAKSRLREISFCALGMDADTSAMAAAGGEQVEIEVITNKEAEMPEEKVEPKVDVDALKAEAKAEAVARFDELFNEFGQDFAVEMFRAGKSLEDARAEHYENLKAEVVELRAKLAERETVVVDDGREEPVPTGSPAPEETPRDLKATAQQILRERNSEGENLTLGQAMKLAMIQLGRESDKEA